MLCDQNQVQFIAKPTFLKGHKNQIRDVVFTHNDKFLISASIDGTVILWDLEEKKKVKNIFQTMYLYEQIEIVAVSDCNKLLAISCQDNGVHLYNISNLPSCSLFFQIQRGRTDICKIQFSSNAHLVVLVEQNKVHVWNLKFKKLVYTYENSDINGEVKGIAISSDIEFAVLHTFRDGIIIYYFSTKRIQILHNYEHDPYGLGVDISKDQTKLVTSGIYGEVKLWKLRDIQENEKALDLIWTFLIFDNYIPRVIFSPDGNQILSICPIEGKIKILNTQSGFEIQVLEFKKASNLKTYICTNNDMSIIAGGGGMVDEILLWTRNINIMQTNNNEL